MEQLQLKPRATGANAKPHQLRAQGVLPLAIVATNKETMLAQMDRAAFETAMGHTDGIAKFTAKLEGESKAFEVLVREVQKNPLSRRTIHAVLQRVSESDVLKVQVAIVIHGDPECVQKGRSTLTQVTDHVELKGELGKLPEHIEVDVSGLDDVDKISVADLKLPEGVECLTSMDATVVTTQTIRTAAAAEETEGGEGGEGAGEAAPAAEGGEGSE